MQTYSYDNLPVHPSDNITQEGWLDQIPVHGDFTVPSTASHAYLGPPHNVGHLSTDPLPSSNDPVQPRHPFTVSAEDQLRALAFIRAISSGHIDRSEFFSEHWGASSSGYPCFSNTPLQVEESHGVGISQPSPYFDLAPQSFSIHPVAPLAVPPYEKTANTNASPSSPEAGGCQRRARGNQKTRFHPASVPQALSRGMRKTWGAAAAVMSLESTIEELRREDVDEETIGTVKEIFSASFSVEALMRKMSKDESTRYLNGERAQAYRALLREVNERFQCRLCQDGPNAMSWKHPRDVVRHLRRDHFGLGDSCQACNHVGYTTGEMTNHRCKGNRN